MDCVNEQFLAFVIQKSLHHHLREELIRSLNKNVLSLKEIIDNSLECARRISLFATPTKNPFNPSNPPKVNPSAIGHVSSESNSPQVVTPGDSTGQPTPPKPCAFCNDKNHFSSFCSKFVTIDSRAKALEANIGSKACH